MLEISGPFILNRIPVGWGDIDDAESIRAIHRASEMGINFLYTADCYRIGYSEDVIGKAKEGRRDRENCSVIEHNLNMFCDASSLVD